MLDRVSDDDESGGQSTSAGAKPVSPAVARGMEMLRIPMGDLPSAAILYASYLCRRVGMCTEVMLSAYVAHAQIVDGLACDDPLYFATPEVRAGWEEAQRDYELDEYKGDGGALCRRVRRKIRE